MYGINDFQLNYLYISEARFAANYISSENKTQYHTNEKRKKKKKKKKKKKIIIIIIKKKPLGGPKGGERKKFISEGPKHLNVQES